MKKILPYLILSLSIISCQNEIKHSTVHEYLLKKQQKNTSQQFPFQLNFNVSIPSYSPNEGMYIFEKSYISNTAYYFSGDEYAVKKINVSNSQETGMIYFNQLPVLFNQKFAKCEVLNNNTLIWYADSSLIHVFTMDGNFIETHVLPLTYQNRNFSIATTSHTHIEYFESLNTLIIPVQCMSDYDEDEIHTLPQFISYNLSTQELDFINIYLPSNYPQDKYLGNLSFPLTAKDGNYFYAIYPLNETAYKYNVSNNQFETIQLQLPVSLSNPSELNEPQNHLEMGTIESYATRIHGFAVINDYLYVQQTGAWDESLQSKKFIDNTVLYIFNSQGGLTWSGGFPGEIFDNMGVFKIAFASEGSLKIISHDKHNEQRFIQITPEN